MKTMDDFSAAVSAVRNLPESPSVDDGVRLLFYALYKQATVGNNSTEQPGIFHFTARAKWDAWTRVKGMSQEEAKVLYVRKLDNIMPTWRTGR